MLDCGTGTKKSSQLNDFTNKNLFLAQTKSVAGSAILPEVPSGSSMKAPGYFHVTVLYLRKSPWCRSWGREFRRWLIDFLLPQL
jgi:hypothetical protein